MQNDGSQHAVVNRLKELEERVMREIDNLTDRQDHSTTSALNGEFADQRLLAIGKTQLQGAFMFLARAVFQPQRIRLPEDDELFSGKGDQVLHETDAKGG